LIDEGHRVKIKVAGVHEHVWATWNDFLWCAGIYRVAQKSKLLTQDNSLLFWATLYIRAI